MSLPRSHGHGCSPSRPGFRGGTRHPTYGGCEQSRTSGQPVALWWGAQGMAQRGSLPAGRPWAEGRLCPTTSCDVGALFSFFLFSSFIEAYMISKNLYAFNIHISTALCTSGHHELHAGSCRSCVSPAPGGKGAAGETPHGLVMGRGMLFQPPGRGGRARAPAQPTSSHPTPAALGEGPEAQSECV